MLIVGGCVDLSTVDRLRRVAYGFLACSIRNLRLDASALEFFDSSGLALLAELRAIIEARGGTLAMVNVPPLVEKVLRVAGMEDVLDLR